MPERRGHRGLPDHSRCGRAVTEACRALPFRLGRTASCWGPRRPDHPTAGGVGRSTAAYPSPTARARNSCQARRARGAVLVAALTAGRAPLPLSTPISDLHRRLRCGACDERGAPRSMGEKRSATTGYKKPRVRVVDAGQVGKNQHDALARPSATLSAGARAATLGTNRQPNFLSNSSSLCSASAMSLIRTSRTSLSDVTLSKRS